MVEQSPSVDVIDRVVRPPVYRLPNGAMRINGTRVSVEILINTHNREGYTAEDLHDAFDTVSLADAYAVLAWYHANRAELDAYVAARMAEGERLRAEWEAVQMAKPGYREWREGLLQRFADYRAKHPEKFATYEQLCSWLRDWWNMGVTVHGEPGGPYDIIGLLTLLDACLANLRENATFDELEDAIVALDDPARAMLLELAETVRGNRPRATFAPPRLSPPDPA